MDSTSDLELMYEKGDLLDAHDYDIELAINKAEELVDEVFFESENPFYSAS